MRRILLLALVACGSHARSADPAIGRWRGENDRIIELGADFSLDIRPVPSRDCQDATAVIADCRARQRWSRSGSTVTLARATISREPARPMASPGPCACHIERIEVELRGDELVAGHERLQRVTAPKPATDPAP